MTDPSAVDLPALRLVADPSDAEGTLQRLCALVHQTVAYPRRLARGVQTPAETLELRTQEVSANIDERVRDVRELGAALDQAKRAAQKLIAKCNTMAVSRSESHETTQGEQPQNQTPEELETVIEGLTARLEMVHEGNPNVMREYEERGRKIEKTQEKLAGIEKELGRLDEKITSLRARWEPELDALIAKISHAFGDNFARIGCAGQVEVYKDDDFEHWAVQVLVKFRSVTNHWKWDLY